MACDPARFDAAAWAELAAAAVRPDAGFRYLTLCSVDAQARPQARTVVLRQVDAASRMLEIHTDVRSPKWRELAADPQATVLGFCARARLQLRFQGVVGLHPPGSARAREAWQRLPAWTRQTYTGGPPGDALAFGAVDVPHPTQAPGATEGEAHFGVLAFRARSLDWFRLRRQGNRRAFFTYGADGVLAEGRWVHP